MHKLADKRQAKHRQLIGRLSEKVRSIKENKERLGGKVDYETNLLIMEDANVADDVESSDDPEPDSKVIVKKSRGDDKSDLTQSEIEKKRLYAHQ